MHPANLRLLNHAAGYPRRIAFLLQVSIFPPSQELLPDFRPVLEAYFEAMLDLGRRLMRLLALCLDLPPSW